MAGPAEPAEGQLALCVCVFLGLSAQIYFKYSDFIDDDEESRVLKGNTPNYSRRPQHFQKLWFIGTL